MSGTSTPTSGVTAAPSVRKEGAPPRGGTGGGRRRREFTTRRGLVVAAFMALT